MGVLGGTFDPPHLGHLILANECWWQLRLDEVRFVPAARSPLKEAPALSDELRARLVARAIEGHPAFSLSLAELERPAPSYTVETLRGFASAEPGVVLWLVIGADQLVDFDRWVEHETIVELARLAVVGRDGVEVAELRERAEALAPGRVDWVAMPRVDISSRMIRARMAARESIRYLVPDGIAELLAEAEVG